ncbi:MAG: class I SAM-dependent methyltransferase [Gammaproteobacteria bacterium]|nr:class I SAM-dependent methyltransferase [Gammaproteobacteria bacterium]
MDASRPVNRAAGAAGSAAGGARAAGVAGTVDFGRLRVSPEEKSARVEEVFRTVAGRYDAMNDLMSGGFHRILKRVAVDSTGLRPGQRALDLAGGTGDLSRLLAPIVGPAGAVVLCDVNASMLAVGRDRVIDAGLANVETVRADAEALPFATESFDSVVIAFGLRNLTDKERGLREMHLVLRPGGSAVVLEFSTARDPWIARASGLWQSFWPLLGRVVAGDAAPYRYLVDSIAVHPGRVVLATMMEDAGFADVAADGLLGGVVALHRGRK